MTQLTYETSLMLNTAERIKEEIQESIDGKDHVTEMMNTHAFDLNMILYLLDPITVASASIAHLTDAKNKNTLEAVGLVRKRVNFFSIYNLVDSLTSTTLEMKATQKLCLDRHAVRLQALERKVQAMADV